MCINIWKSTTGPVKMMQWLQTLALFLAPTWRFTMVYNSNSRKKQCPLLASVGTFMDRRHGGSTCQPLESLLRSPLCVIISAEHSQNCWIGLGTWYFASCWHCGSQRQSLPFPTNRESSPTPLPRWTVSFSRLWYIISQLHFLTSSSTFLLPVSGLHTFFPWLPFCYRWKTLTPSLLVRRGKL